MLKVGYRVPRVVGEQNKDKSAFYYLVGKFRLLKRVQMHKEKALIKYFFLESNGP